MLAFGLCNEPAVFQQLLNSVYADELGRFVVVYLDAILVYSKSEAEHVVMWSICASCCRGYENTSCLPS